MTLLDNTLHSIKVLCKDCGKDAGWTGEHHCSNQQKLQLPTLCSSTSSQHNDSSDEDQPPEPFYVTKRLSKREPEKSMENGIWTFFKSSYDKPVKQNIDDEPSIYYDTYTAQLHTANINPRRVSKVRENDKWKDLASEKKEEKKGKLWDKLFQSSETISNLDNCEGDSDQEDWEGETHISRILREYYQNKHQSLPKWLLSDKSSVSGLAPEAPFQKPQPRSRKLWEVDAKISPRERERLALRRGSFEEQVRRKSENCAQPRMKAENRCYDLNLVRRTQTVQPTIP
ncbi:hypothetical protein K501DRAFT_265525 [Backusella circina FSU 941]|nr:hypothetical protein K501DRAFT_265525 [Backusella circina FSU 941]